MVIAYIDIGQAEEWRTYWQPGWRVGSPAWIVAEDPDGWQGNYPVAYWHQDWRQLWLAPDGYLTTLIEAGFDGIYLDWVEAYSDETVITAAEGDDVNARQAMLDWVNDLATYSRAQREDFIVIAQNAVELVEDQAYLQVIDAISQEQTWFDGAADNDPSGDCPLPSREVDVESQNYLESLSPPCLALYEEFSDSTLACQQRVVSSISDLSASAREDLFYRRLCR